MPRFQFNIRDDQGLISDEEGMDLPNTAAACREAEEGAREILADAIRNHRGVDGRKIEVVAENGDVVATINLRDVLGA